MFLKSRSVLVQSNKIITSKGHISSWIARSVNGFLLDIYGVLYDSGLSDSPIAGSMKAVKKYLLSFHVYGMILCTWNVKLWLIYDLDLDVDSRQGPSLRHHTDNIYHMWFMCPFSVL